MVCKMCGVHYSARNEILCHSTENHLWPELNEPVPAESYESAQPCGCDPGCKPKPHVCQWHQNDATYTKHYGYPQEGHGG